MIANTGSPQGRLAAAGEWVLNEKRLTERANSRTRECTGTGFQARSLVKLLTGFLPAGSFK